MGPAAAPEAVAAVPPPPTTTIVHVHYPGSCCTSTSADAAASSSSDSLATPAHTPGVAWASESRGTTVVASQQQAHPTHPPSHSHTDSEWTLQMERSAAEMERRALLDELERRAAAPTSREEMLEQRIQSLEQQLSAQATDPATSTTAAAAAAAATT